MEWYMGYGMGYGIWNGTWDWDRVGFSLMLKPHPPIANGIGNCPIVWVASICVTRRFAEGLIL
jgi:hypothetical protein